MALEQRETDRQYVTFGIDKEIFAIPVAVAKEILDPGPLSRLPRAPDYLLGLMDVRGIGIPIVDLRARLGLGAIEQTPNTRVIILENWGEDRPPIGLMTDCVFEVTNLGGIELQQSPSIGAKWRSDCIIGIGRRGDDFVIVLRLDRLFETDDIMVRDKELAA